MLRILLTNDDGIDAAGLAALETATRAALPNAHIFIAAPATVQSQGGHRVTTHTPLRAEPRGEDRWAIHGSPADCVRIALRALDLTPDWVFSGINEGGNMGQDLPISGTVAAVREAAYHGVRGMAFSHFIRHEIPLDWAVVTPWVADLISEQKNASLERGTFWNFNLPHLPGATNQPLPRPEIVDTQPAHSPLPVRYAALPHAEDGSLLFQYTGRYAERPADGGSDVEACFSGRISRSQISI
ncbi:MAG: 5'/3'-nucleotidase SurE [Verrucomicrobiales bacterium]|nr:5'/3'-nucleotidase SurE [Verrucomicrobiales bacterium]